MHRRPAVLPGCLQLAGIRPGAGFFDRLVQPQFVVLQAFAVVPGKCGSENPRNADAGFHADAYTGSDNHAYVNSNAYRQPYAF